jgi:dTDP-4-amino-4,6-dideoxy-D-galactose acyltransferase
MPTTPSHPRTDETPCEPLAWDTQLFGLSIARVRGDTLTTERAEAIDRWCRANGTKLLYFLARSDDPTTAAVAEQAGYREVDRRVTLHRSLAGSHSATDNAITPFVDSDLDALRQIARGSYHDSRFYHDGRLPRAKCDELFDLWTTQACQRHPDHVLVAREDDTPVGYVTCKTDPTSREATIDLIGVAESARGRGVGKRLVDAALGWAALRGATTMSVVTQTRNTAAIRLYERRGFVTSLVQRYYHKWYD